MPDNVRTIEERLASMTISQKEKEFRESTLTGDMFPPQHKQAALIHASAAILSADGYNYAANDFFLANTPKEAAKVSFDTLYEVLIQLMFKIADLESRLSEVENRPR